MGQENARKMMKKTGEVEKTMESLPNEVFWANFSFGQMSTVIGLTVFIGYGDDFEQAAI